MIYKVPPGSKLMPSYAFLFVCVQLSISFLTLNLLLIKRKCEIMLVIQPPIFTKKKISFVTEALQFCPLSSLVYTIGKALQLLGGSYNLPSCE